ncbi:MAG: hypothetical protein IKX31_06325 [Muribaculaceae bacterium]|nr:hypothetical protein [Muribaculaceae bacterium]
MEKQYDNNIELFDAYLNNTLSDAVRAELEKRLNYDEALREEFQKHKLFVATLQATCSDTNQEFENAMKNISDEDFQHILNEKKSNNANKEENKSKSRMVPLKTVYRWMSAAAVVLIFAGIGNIFYNKSKTEELLCATVVDSYDFNSAVTTQISRGGSSSVISIDNVDDEVKDDYKQAIYFIKNNNTEKAIKILEKLYSDPDQLQTKDLFATKLAYAYTKNRDIKNATRIIKEVKKDHNGNTPESLKALEKALKAL